MIEFFFGDGSLWAWLGAFSQTAAMVALAMGVSACAKWLYERCIKKKGL